MGKRDKRHYLTEHQLFLRAEHDPEALEAYERWREIKAKGGMPHAWKTERDGYTVRDELEIRPEELRR